MSKIVVDKMPEKPGDCPYNLGYLCGIKETPCKLSLQNPEPCDKLITAVDVINENIRENFNVTFSNPVISVTAANLIGDLSRTCRREKRSRN